MKRDKWLNTLNRRFGRYAISNLMTIIVGGMAIVYLADMFMYPATRLSMKSLLAFNREAILHGQVWRLLSFVFIPPDSSVLYILFSLYFYWMVGSALEREWGSFRFNVYYLCGVIGTIAAGMITGYATNEYLNLSLILAFAAMAPDYQLLLFFCIPVKIKYLTALNAIGILVTLISGTWSGRIALLFSLANVLIFFGEDMIDRIKYAYRRYKFRIDMGGRK